MTKNFFLLGGYTKWSKKLKNKFYNFGHKAVAYSKFKKNNSDLKKINYRSINSFQFVVLASDYKSNNNFLINLLKRNYSKYIFIEKPLSINKKQISVIKKLNRKNIIFTNHQHNYADSIKKIINYHKKNKKNWFIDLRFGKKGPSKINPILEWGPHVFSLLENFISLKKFDIKIYKIIKSNRNFYNIKIKMKYKNNFVNLLFGNNFQKKTYQLVYKTNGKKFIYDGKKNKLNKENIKKNLTSNDPLSNCIKVFLSNKKKHFKKNFQNAINSMSTVFIIEQLYNKKFNYKF
jgi:hypothetical protein